MILNALAVWVSVSVGIVAGLAAGWGTFYLAVRLIAWYYGVRS